MALFIILTRLYVSLVKIKPGFNACNNVNTTTNTIQEFKNAIANAIVLSNDVASESDMNDAMY